MKVICATILMFGLSMLAGAGVADVKKAAPAEAVSPHLAVDAKEVAAVAARIKERLKASPEALAKESQRLVLEVQTELEYGRALAVLDTHVSILQQHHLECQLRAQDLADERKAAGKELEAELNRIKDNYRSNPEIVERLQVDLIVTCRETLRSLKAEEDGCIARSAATFKQLAVLKLQKAQLDEKKRSKAREPIALPASGGLILPMPKIETKPSVANPSRESLQEALDSIKTLTK